MARPSTIDEKDIAYEMTDEEVTKRFDDASKELGQDMSLTDEILAIPNQGGPDEQAEPGFALAQVLDAPEDEPRGTGIPVTGPNILKAFLGALLLLTWVFFGLIYKTLTGIAWAVGKGANGIVWIKTTVERWLAR